MAERDVWTNLRFDQTRSVWHRAA